MEPCGSLGWMQRKPTVTLSLYRASVALEGDGWHVDYELKEPQLQGGGPHYVIDPGDGKILVRLYEQ
jgi:hypothetical protein